MSPVGQALSDWLKTSPGAIQGSTSENVLAYAHKCAGQKSRVLRDLSAQDFEEALERVGYAPQARTRHDGSRTEYFILLLPEGL